MKTLRKNNKGIASIEAAAMMVIFVLLMAYGIGMFGVIHTGILNSIAARTYAWETFNHRTNVGLFRDRSTAASSEHFVNYGFRIHSIQSEAATSEFWEATERNIAMGVENPEEGRSSSVHNQLSQLTKREKSGVNPVWIKTMYGICLNSTCGTVAL